MNKNEFICPICKINAEEIGKNRYFPFCSKRCQLLDLGAWASESYRVESKEKISFDELSEDEFEE